MADIKRFAGLLIVAVALVSCASAELVSVPVPVAQPEGWLQQLEQQAMDDGVSAATVHGALDAFVPDPRVVALDQKQPEKTISFATYRHNIVTAARIKKGAELMRLYAHELGAIEARTGVPPQIVVALWGMESSYGKNMGDFETVNALATLAYQGRRADFFRAELMAALHILDQEHLSAHDLRGSWAGAMGQCQFMPSTYVRYAVDGTGDGHRDIWRSPVDVLASIANYLAAEGWRREGTWGREVTGDIDSSEVSSTQTRSLAQWTEAGITNLDGSPLPQRDVQAALIKPDADADSGFLVYDNIHALMRWNHSTYFAVSVGLLADGIAGASR